MQHVGLAGGIAAATLLASAAPARADPLGVFAFLPPFSQALPTGGTGSVDTAGLTLSGDEGEPKLLIGGHRRFDVGASSRDPRGLDIPSATCT